MINVFLNEEFGYQHWMWEYPGTVEELVEDWLTGYAPFNRTRDVYSPTGERRVIEKTYKGTLTNIPTKWDPSNPFGPNSPMFSGTQSKRLICRPDGTQEWVPAAGNQMDDFFAAYGEVSIDNSYLRVGDDYYWAHGDLAPEEEKFAEEFSWLEWTEDPEWYREWEKTYRYRCGSSNNAVRVKKLHRGRLGPQESHRVEAHLSRCLDCQQVWKEFSKKFGKEFGSDY